MKPGYDAERELDGRGGEGAADRVGRGVLHRAAQQGRGAPPRCRRRRSAALASRPRHLGRREPRPELLAHPGGLGLDVEAGEHELDLVAAAAELVDADLEPLGRGLAADADDRDAVLGLLLEPDGVEVDGHVGAEVAGRLDLVDQLRGDGVDGDRAAGAGVLGDHARPVGRDLGDREAQRPVAVGQVEEAARSCRRSPGCRTR